MEIDYKQAKVILRGMTCLNEYEAKAIDIAIRAINTCNESMTKKYRKKPVFIEAIQWNGENLSEIDKFTQGKVKNHESVLIVPTNYGETYASLNDYIIKEANGNLHPCKTDVFANTYEKVTE